MLMTFLVEEMMGKALMRKGFPSERVLVLRLEKLLGIFLGIEVARSSGGLNLLQRRVKTRGDTHGS